MHFNRDAQDPVETSLSQKMLSAVTGSILTSLLVTPLDVVRVRLQSQSSPSPSISSSSTDFVKLPPNIGISTCCREVFWVQNQGQFCVATPSNASVVEESLISGCAAEESQRRTFNSTLDGLRKIARNEGIFTLWRGLSPTLLMAVPGNVIYFAGYDWLRQNKYSPMKNRVSDAYAPLVAGSAARVMAAIVVSPIEMLRTRMQASHPSTTGAVMKETIAGLKDMVGVNGYRSLWRGLTLTLWRDVPFSAFYWWGYEYGREALHDRRERTSGKASLGISARSRDQHLDHKTVLIDSFIAGAASGAISAFVTTPFDVGKTRQQIARHAQEGGSSSLNTAHGSIPAVRPEDRSMPKFLWHIFKTEGTAGLFKGWAARCLKVAPACAIMISSYELGKKMAGGINEKRENAA
ncbi:mitochondrial carrier [Myriangium duriaei CBS 260.36]|uniref:Mitochondrial carrier n=1 Tax=Myriangium duriaei CBS 260.36 TaxID=1168546 RepID=A0A9P4MJD4_9PEZI|nr:mitochondrial carrier [Myriangium duriaei CBS 260.36]